MKKLEVTLSTHRLQQIEQALSTCPIDSLTVATVLSDGDEPTVGAGVGAGGGSGWSFAPRFRIDIVADDCHCAEIVALLQSLGPPAESAELLVTDVIALIPIRPAELPTGV
jgi:nitrogen regulatory protein PII